MSSANGLTLVSLLMWIIDFVVYLAFVCLFVILNILYGSWLCFLIILLLVTLVILLLLLNSITILLSAMIDRDSVFVLLENNECIGVFGNYVSATCMMAMAHLSFDTCRIVETAVISFPIASRGNIFDFLK